MPIVLRSLTRRALAILAVAGLLAGSIVVLGAPTAAEAATHTVTGTVYRDFDGDGVRDVAGTGLDGVQVDAGVANITVTATDAHGTSWTATTNSLGAYSLSVVDPFTTKLRVTFATPSPYKPSAHGTGNATSVRFIDVATSQSDIDYALNAPEDYALNNPPIVTAIQYSGLSSSTSLVNSPTLAAAPWSQNYGLTGSTTPPAEPDWDLNGGTYPGRTTLATVPQTGSIWGTAYDPKTDALFAAATYKRHSGIGPLGIGGIYKVSDVLTSAGVINAGSTVSSWLDVTTLNVSGTPINVGSIPGNAGGSGRNLGTPQSPARDIDSFANAGKVGIGGVAVDPTAGKLYFVNLFDKKIYRVDIANPTTVAVTSYDPGLTVGQRPWALTINRGTLYVGYVDSGETAADGDDPGRSAASAGLQYHVKAAALTAPATWTVVLDGSLGYAKGQVAPDPSAQEIRWNTWADTWSWTGTNAGSVAVTVSTWSNGNAQIYPQAMLTDLAFDTDGYLVLGLGDRTATQGGNRNYGAFGPPGNTLYETFSNGDLLIASPDGDGTFTPESNGVVGTRTTTAGEANQGPGGTEFFNDRQAIGTGAFHQETTLGGVASLPGSSRVVATSFDPLADIRVAGENWFSLTTGAVEAGYQQNLDPGGSATSTGTFQKAGGLGDVDVIAFQAPLEIGNRVWFDADRDGAQDADEPPVAGVTVALLQGATVISTTTTSSTGEYYFSSASIAAFAPNGGAYTVRFTTPSAGSLFSADPIFGTVAWADVSFTTTDAASVDDSLDSDAVVASQHIGNASYTAGGPGDNDHTLDAGLIASASFRVTKVIDPSGATPSGSTTFSMTAQARDFRGDAITLPAADASFSLVVGGTKTITLPAGSDAQVAETSTAGISSTTVSPASWFDVAGTTAAPTAVTVTNRLYLPGTFTVSKTVTGGAAGLVPTSTSFTVEYSTDSGSSWTPITVTPATASTAVSLPYGTNVQLREATRPSIAGVTWGTPTWSGSGVTTVSGTARFTIGDGTNVGVGLSNPTTLNNGQFTVTKSVTGTGSALVPGATSFSVEYSTNGGSSWTPLTVTPGSTTSAVALPYGTSVLLRETAPSAITGLTWGTPVWSGSGVTTVTGNRGSFTIGDGTVVAVGLQNPTTRNNGTFTVTKSVTGGGSGLVPGATSFTLEYSTDAGSTWTPITVTPGSTTSAVTLPYGANVQLRETAPSAITGLTWGTPMWTGTGVTTVSGTARFTIGDGTNVSVGVANPTTRNSGTFIVTKSITGSGSALVPGSTSFTVEYSTDGGTSWTPITVTPSLPAVPVTLPYGTSVTVREAVRPVITGLTWGTPTWAVNGTPVGGTTATFSIGDGTNVAIGLTNPATRNNGTFTLTKTVTGSGSALVPGSTSFTVEYSTDGGTSWTPLTVTPGSTTTAVTLPYGTSVQVREATRPSLAGVTWGSPAWTVNGTPAAGTTASFTIGDTTNVALGLTNPATRNSGTFTVTKSVTGTGAALVPSSTSFTVEYSTDGGSVWTPITVTPALPSAPVALPYGTNVLLREATPPTIAGVSWGSPTLTVDGVPVSGTTADFTIGDGTIVAVGLSNPTTRNSGSFIVTKSVTGSGSTLVPGATTFTVEYSTDGGSVWTPITVTSLLPSSPVTLPYGTSVQLREATPPLVPGVTWGSPAWSVDGTPVAGTTVSITVGDGTTIAVGLENPTTQRTGTFTVAKSLTGDATDLGAARSPFTIEYTTDGGANWTPISIAAGATSASVTLNYGTSVTVRETAPVAVTGMSWGSPAWTVDGIPAAGTTASFTIGDGTNVELDVENPTIRHSGSFDVAKALSGDATDLIPGLMSFTVQYSTNGGLLWNSLSVSAGGTSSTVTLPYGTHVLLREVTPSGVPGLDWGTPTWGGAADNGDGTASFDIGDTVHLAVDLTNPTVRHEGDFTVTKTLTGDATDLGAARSPFTIEYTVDGGAVWTPLVIAAGATSSAVTLPYGTVVTVRETAPATVTGMSWGTPTWSLDGGPAVAGGSQTFTIGNQTTVAVGLENPTTRHTGDFTVTKSVSGTGAAFGAAAGPFTVQYSTNGGGSWTDLTVAASATTAPVSLPYGTVVTVREAPRPAVTAIDWETPEWSIDGGPAVAAVTRTFTVGDGTTVAVGLDNPATLLEGSFTVTKTVTGEGSVYGSAGDPFTVEYTSDGGSTWAPLTVPAGATTTPVVLPNGTVVTLREVVPAAVTGITWADPAWSGGVVTNPDNSATFTVGNGTALEVQLENPTTLVKTGFTVTKSVTGAAAASVPNSLVFSVDYDYTDSSGAHSGTLTLSKNNPTASVGAVIPFGTLVTLSEVAPAGAPADVSWLTPAYTGTGVTDHHDGTASFVAGASSLSIDLENPTDQLVGDLKISKSVTGSALGSVPPGFNFTVEYSYGTTSGSRTITDGASVVLTGIPAGTVVTLSEAPRVGAPVDVQWETPIWTHGSVTDTGTTTVTVVAGTEVEVALENPTTRLYNGFSITKVVSGDAAGSVPNDFEFTVTYSPAGNPAGPLVLTKAAPSASVTDLPLGTVVTLKETAPGSAAPDVAWGTPVFTGTTFTNNPDGSVSFTVTAAPIAVVLTNPTTRLFGDFSITKDVTGPAEDTLDDDFEFSGTYSYTGIAPVPFTIENGQTWTLPYADRIPAGTTVTVTETTPIGGLPALSGWGLPIFSGTGVTVGGPGSATFVIGANTTVAVGLENPTTVTPRVDIEKGDGAGSVIAHDADTMPDGEHYQPGETRTIVLRVTNTGTEDLRRVLLTDDTLSGAEVEGISWAFPDGTSANAALVGEDWVARWDATFGSGTSFWVPGDVIIGTATLTVDAAADAHVDNARVDAVGRYSGTPVEDEDAYNAFTGDIQVIKYDGRIAGPTVQSGGDWVVPAKPLANPFQDANDAAHAAQSIANVPVRIDWVVTNIGTTTLTDVMVSDTTLLGPAIQAWTCDLSDVGGPAVYSFLDDGPWPGLLAPSASFFCTGSVTLAAGGKHTDVADVEAHVIFPEVDGDGIPTGNPMLDGDDLPVLALDDLGEPIVVDDDDPFLDPAAVELAFTGVEPWMPLAAGIAVLSVLLGVLAVALPRRRRSVARHR